MLEAELPTMSTVLSVDNLTVGFGDRTIIENLSFEVSSGDALAVIGPNGAGKTLLFKALLNLIPYKGTVRWKTHLRPGYVPQKVESDRQLPLTVRDLLTAKCRLLRLPETAVDLVLSAAGLTPDLLDSRIGILSGGQFQKVLISFALLGEPDVLLFDEPTASLDELSEEHVYDLLHTLQKERGFTTVLVSHDLSVVYRYATKVLCLSKHPCIGPPAEILTPHMLEELYAAPPKYHQHFHDQPR
jgi:zinc transport system ATP-binding protein